MKNLAVFDFDGTLTRRDTMLPMALHFGMQGNVVSLVKFLFYYVGFKLKLYKNEELKKAFSRCFFKGKSLDQVRDILASFMSKRVQMNHDVYKKFCGYINKNDKVIIVSANFDVVVNCWLKQFGETSVSVLATKLFCKNGIYTGELEGAVCRGGEKAKRLKQFLDIEKYNIISYADEESDSDIMYLADRKHWI